MNTQQKLADALRRLIDSDVGGINFTSAANHKDAIRNGLTVLAEHEAANTLPPDFKVAIFVRRGFVEDVAATVPFEYEVIDADEHDQDPDETETARQRWNRVTKGWVCP